ncbi:tumor suppressor candidate 5-like protein [Labeo rohita]|uniref:Tumor suppressor candidate 5-like protein n=1 Tax=Labeo rohita TaxID=84645 RepID=A0A498MPV5_LABRO|nr:tumor suppressor candidate 5-like protein [Labeo rohita]
MDLSQSFNQPPGAYSSPEKSAMLQPVTKPPVYQDNFAGYPAFSGQTMVAVQPAVFVPTAPLGNPMPLADPLPEYTWYSIFTLLCCCLPLGTAALVYSLSTRSANYSGHQELARKNSKTARNLNHVSVVVGIIFIVVLVVVEYEWIEKTDP